MADILTRIYDAKAAVTAREEEQEPYPAMRDRALARKHERRPFAGALRSAAGPGIVGEIKRASPSAGLIVRNFDPAASARAYEQSPLDCISVLTESDHFLGELAFLDTVRGQTSRPLLRKDFLSTRYQIAQSGAYGADAVLLIVAGLSDEQLRECMGEAALYDLDALVEVHDGAELDRALNAGATIIGINNRNLHTFETDLAVSEYLLPNVPEHILTISESGIYSQEDIQRLYNAGARGFLIGEALMRSDDPAALVRTLKSAAAAMR